MNYNDRRCRYDDCREQHPVAAGKEQVTCTTCRLYLGLEPLCPECESDGPHDDNGKRGDERAFCCGKCGTHFDAVEGG